MALMWRLVTVGVVIELRPGDVLLACFQAYNGELLWH
jgi:hypothetical protein